jgi:hypothetical protein
VGYNFALGTWNFRLGTADTDAWPEIQAVDVSNLEPLPGWSYVMVPVTYTYLGGTSARPWVDTTVDFLGSNNVIYDEWSTVENCQLFANDTFDIADLYPGGAAAGNNCAVVPTSAVEGGMWRVRSLSAPGIERFVAIR